SPSGSRPRSGLPIRQRSRRRKSFKEGWAASRVNGATDTRRRRLVPLHVKRNGPLGGRAVSREEGCCCTSGRSLSCPAYTCLCVMLRTHVRLNRREPWAEALAG